MVEVILLIVSSVIGAGFATGAELATFFGAFAVSPFIVAIMYGAISFGIICILAFFGGTRNPRATPIFTAIYIVFFIVMTAGLMHIGGWLTALIAILICNLLGGNRIGALNKYIMIFVLCILLWACLTNLHTPATANAPTNFALLAANVILYGALNCCVLESIIPNLLKTHTRKKVLLACAIAIVIICTFIVLILTAIRGVTAPMPILQLSPNLITTAAVFFAIFTSMLICFDSATSHGKTFYKIAISLFAFAFGFLGFKSILGALYPVIAFIFLCYVGFLCVQFALRNRQIVHNSVNRLNIVQNN